MGIEEVRRGIDRVDGEIVRLLDERARLGGEIGEIKRRMGLPLHHPGREEDVLRRLRALSDGSMPRHSLDGIYRVIMAETLALQKGPSCCGDHGGEGKRDVAATILENCDVGAGFFRMRVLAPELVGVFRPGQFFQLRIGEAGGAFFLRRPFAPAEGTGDGFAFFYAVVGDGTRAMAGLKPGREVNILAPLGNAYTPLSAGAGAVLMGGGVGAPSLAPLACWLREGGVRTTVILGARTASALLGREVFQRVADRVIIATDDGSEGYRGNVGDAFRRERASLGGIDRLYACGPLPMLRAVAGLAEECGVDCEVSLEERMACGFGACMGCVAPVMLPGGGSAFRRVCHDGPVFNAAQLAWDEMAGGSHA